MTDKHICPLPGCGLEMVFMGYPALDGLPGSMWFCTAGPPDSREHQLSSKVAELEERLANRLFTNQLAKDKIYALQAELVQAQTRIAELEKELTAWNNIDGTTSVLRVNEQHQQKTAKPKEKE